MNKHPPLILASASSARASMLKKAGVLFACEPANIDEGKIKEREKSNGSGGERTALALAEAKAYTVSVRYPGVLVVGADQILECGDDWFDKPPDLTAAAETLKQLRNRTHKLVTAVVAMRGGINLWEHVDIARLTMRPFSDGFLRRYLNEAGDGILESVGAYRIEGMGIQLFSHIEGDHFTVLGMPLLPLLDFFRRNHLLAT